MSKTKLFLTFILSLAFSSGLFASHIIAGRLRCNFIKLDSGKYTYQVELEAYRLCKDGSMYFPNNMEICVYNRDNNSKTATLNANQTGLFKIYNCYGTCVEYVKYTGYVKMAKNTNGYSIKNEICCRTDAVNFKNDQANYPYIGLTFECFIRPEFQVVSPGLYNSALGSNALILNSFADNTYKTKMYPTTLSGRDVETIIEAPKSGASLNNNYPGCSDNYTAPQKININEYASGFSSNFLLGNNGTLNYNTADSILTLKASGPGFYYFTLRNNIYNDTTLIYSHNNEMVYNVSISQLPPVVTLNGTKTEFNAIKLDWIPDCMLNTVVKNVVLKSIGNPNNFTAIGSLTSGPLTFSENNLPLKTKLYYKVMVITDVQDTFYSNVLETEMWNTGIHYSLNDKLNFYPNPSDGAYNLNISGMSVSSVKLMSADGKQIENYGFSIDQDNLKLNLSGLNNGLYLVQITLKDGRQLRSQLILQK